MDGNGLQWKAPVTQEPRKASTPILSHEFRQDADGRITLLGPAKVLFTNGPHHDGLVEGQFVLSENGQSYLAYSAGCFGNSQYRTYIARVDLLADRVTDERSLIDSESPALGGQWNGPGHPSFVKVGDGLYAMYLHVWRNGTDYAPPANPNRTLRLGQSRLSVTTRRPWVSGGSVPLVRRMEYKTSHWRNFRLGQHDTHWVKDFLSWISCSGRLPGIAPRTFLGEHRGP